MGNCLFKTEVYPDTVITRLRHDPAHAQAYTQSMETEQNAGIIFRKEHDLGFLLKIKGVQKLVETEHINPSQDFIRHEPVPFTLLCSSKIEEAVAAIEAAIKQEGEVEQFAKDLFTAQWAIQKQGEPHRAAP